MGERLISARNAVLQPCWYFASDFMTRTEQTT